MKMEKTIVNFRKEQFSLDAYDYPNDVKKILIPIKELILKNEIILAEKQIALLALQLCDSVECGNIQPDEADKYFTLLDIYIGDNHKELFWNESLKDLLLEGMMLHDYGTEYGPEISTMRKLAKKIFGGVS